MVRSSLSSLSGLLLVAGCNSFDAKPPPDDGSPRLVIPVDDRQPLHSSAPALPITGGTLSVSTDGKYAVAADPERDTLSVVDLTSPALVATVALEPGDEPGRSVFDASGRVHVALRRAGALVDIDPATGTVLERRAVCKAPRGIAYDAVTDLLHVACADGKLVSLSAQGGEPVRTLALDADLRDVIVRGSELWLTRFKSAELLRLDATGALKERSKLPLGSGQLLRPIEGDQFGGVEAVPVTLDAEVAWRTIPTSDGGVMVVHQHAVNDEIEIDAPTATGSSYGGGGFDCGGIVRNSIALVSSSGAAQSQEFVSAPLAVDVAISPDQNTIVVANPGTRDMFAPRPTLVFPDEENGGMSEPGFGGGFGGGLGGMIIIGKSMLDPSVNGPCAFPASALTDQEVVAVAFAPDGRILAQTREPAQFVVMDGQFGAPQKIALAGDSRLDTGHQLFHHDSGGGIACASCHPEGGEDGHVWHFASIGERRTQALNVGLEGTAPFHWSGDLDSVAALMTQVFVGRMGGVRQSADRLSVLSDWLFGIEQPVPMRDSSDDAALRGRELFESAALGCSTCHTGEKFTNNQSVAVGTLAAEGKLQVPSLIGVGYRAPFMHNGCAADLAGRFDPACGGELHGNTGSLSKEQIADVIAYMETL